MVEVLCSVRIGVGVGIVGNRGWGVVSGGGSTNVADGGARWRDCCRFPDGIFEELGKTSHIVSHSRCVFVGWPVRKRYFR